MERALHRVIETLRGEHAQVDVDRLVAADLACGELAMRTAPSLFSDHRLVVIEGVDQLAKDVADEFRELCRAAIDGGDLTVVATHPGKNRGKAILDELVGMGARRIECARLNRQSERIDFIRGEFAAAGRSVSEEVARALLEAVGSDLRELANACAQLCAATTERITVETVHRYFRGHAETGGFAVADALLDGDTAGAVEKLRWALATGTPPVLVIGAVAQGLRTLVRVGSAGRGRHPADLARDLGLPPWRIERSRAQLRRWAPGSVAQAFRAVAEADLAVKGGASDPAYALEQMIYKMDAARAAAAR